jgi:SanA protein
MESVLTPENKSVLISRIKKIGLILVGVTGLIGAVIIALNSLVFLVARPHIVSTVAALHHADAVIILGASVYRSGALTPILQDRVEAAVAIYQAGMVDKILVSGDNSDTSYNEVQPVLDYLIGVGIPATDIFLDYAGFDTYDTMYRARDVFGVTSAIVVTQSFHLGRAVFIAQALGITVEGIATVTERGTWYNYLREIPARVKAVFDVLFHSQPTYLGEAIPITGNGRATQSESD